MAGTFSEREGFHGCQMPEQLLGRIIRVSSNPGELVVDPFAGSGTTLAVAKKLGRQWLGIELSADYVKRVTVRIDRCRAGDALDGPADPVRSAPTTAQGKRRGRFRQGRPLLSATRDTEDGVVAAPKSSCKKYSTDLILCDPEVNERFVSACRHSSLPGDESAWNRLLLRLRKAGKLPKLSPRRTHLTPAAMDAYGAASEAAMQLLSLDYGLTLDDILCSPPAAAEFDRLAAQFAGPCKASAFEYRWAALAIRKRAKRSRTLARERCGTWRTRKLPRPIALDAFTPKASQRQAVYVVQDEGHPFYVGETRDLAARVEQLKTELWSQFRPRSLTIIETADQPMRYGLQSVLIGRTNPVLNSMLLRPDYDEAK